MAQTNPVDDELVSALPKRTAGAPGAATKLLKVRTVPGPLLVGAVYIMCPSVVDQRGGSAGRGPQSVQSVP